MSRENLTKYKKVAIPEYENIADSFKHVPAQQMFCTNDGGQLFQQATVTININR